MKLLSVEIPTCDPEVFEKYFELNFKLWSIIKDIIVVNINFQNYTQEQIDKYISYIKLLGIDVYYSTSEYSKPVKLLDIREKVHSNFKTCPYIWIGDDDIALYSENYIHQIVKIIDILESDPTIGVCTISLNSIDNDYLLYIDNSASQCFTGNGLIVRNNREDQCLTAEEYRGLTGPGEDIFNCWSRFVLGYKRLTCLAPPTDVTHYEIRKTKLSGADIHGWNDDGWEVCKQCLSWNDEIEDKFSKIEKKIVSGKISTYNMKEVDSIIKNMMKYSILFLN